MKFVLLESRGGNYLVVAENIAWLRAADNGQTNVGMVGGSPLLVTGSIEEVAAKVLAAAHHAEQIAADAPIATPAPVAAAAKAPTVHAPVIEVQLQAAEPDRSQAVPMPRSTLADRVARAAGPAVKAESQRLMTISD